MTTTQQAATAATTEIEWVAPDGGIWELDESHQTEPVSATLQAIQPAAYAEGFRRAFAPLGLPLSHIAIAFVNDRPYTSVFVHEAPRSAKRPPPNVVLKAVSRLHPAARRRARIAEAALTEDRGMWPVERWDELRPVWIDRLLELQDVDLGALDDAALADHLDRVVAAATESLQLHFELFGAALPVGRFLVAAERWGLDQADAMRAVACDTPIHRAAWERLERLRREIGDARPTDFDQVRAIGTAAAAALDDYLRHHGWWSTTDDLQGTPLALRPDLVLSSVHTLTPPSVDADETLAWLRGRVGTDDRERFDELAAAARRGYATLDDNSAVLGSWSAGIAGAAHREAGRRLAEHGPLATPDDVWTVAASELATLLRGGVGPDAAEVASRVQRRAQLATATPPPFLNGVPAPPDPSVFPAPVAEVTAALGAVITQKFNPARTAVGIGSGTVRGRAVVARTAFEAFDRLEPGDVLVTAATTPAFNAVFPLLGGLVVAEGGAACHAAVVARELGLPAVVGLRSALDEIPDGAVVELDPAAATVTVVDVAS